MTGRSILAMHKVDEDSKYELVLKSDNVKKLTNWMGKKCFIRSIRIDINIKSR